MTAKINITDIIILRNFSEVSKEFWEVIINCKSKEQAQQLKDQIIEDFQFRENFRQYSLACHECKQRICEVYLDKKNYIKSIDTTIYCEKCGEKLWNYQGDDLKNIIQNQHTKRYRG